MPSFTISRNCQVIFANTVSPHCKDAISLMKKNYGCFRNIHDLSKWTEMPANESKNVFLTVGNFARNNNWTAVMNYDFSLILKNTFLHRETNGTCVVFKLSQKL